jgi:peroxiredoxin Q/BCP
MVEEGKKAPVFTLKNQDGEKIALKDFAGKQVVLYFYPKDNTSGCTKEAESFRDNIKAIRKKGAEVIGISGDSVESHHKFYTKLDLPFDLLADEDKKVLEKYGVWQEKKMYGKTYMGIVRTTVIIDEKGKVKKVFPKVKVNGHTEEVLEALDS